jgi:hypothetical protein
MTVEGKDTGKVFYINHDDWRDQPFAESFDEFLAHISDSPATLLSEELGCYARYSEGQTDTQWIPIAYTPRFDQP